MDLDARSYRICDSNCAALSRRRFIELAAAALAPPIPALSQPRPDYRLEIGPVSLELSPRHRLETLGYNGQVPGPLLRLREGIPVTIEVMNRSTTPEVVHWHGLFLDPDIDGSLEEGTAPILPGASTRYRFLPQPAGFRWYHTHTDAGGNLRRAQYGGQHGLLLIEARDDPGGYDREFFLTLHDWDGYLLASDDGSMNPAYNVSTINGKVLGFGEPLRVQQGERVAIHVLNSSPTEVHWVALAGHTLQVIALDGNPVPHPRNVPMLRLAPAERVSVLVTLDQPGVWVLGEVRKHVQAAGMGIVVEYADSHGPARWQQPADLVWDYTLFAASDRTDAGAVAPPILVPLAFEPKFRGHGSMESWTINGRSYPDTGIDPLRQGQRYRLQFINRSQDDHPVHLHRHSFEVRSLGVPLKGASSSPKRLRGLIKDTVLVDAQTVTEVEFTADHPGKTLFHCHQQDHMDMGFMMLIHYA